MVSLVGIQPTYAASSLQGADTPTPTGTATVTPTAVLPPTSTPANPTPISGITYVPSEATYCNTSSQSLLFPYQTKGPYVPPTPSQPHFWRVDISQIGTYELTITPYNNQRFVTLDLQVFDMDCNAAPVASVNSASLLSPSLTYKVTTPSAGHVIYLKVIDGIGADFSAYGYSLYLNFKPNPKGVIDAKEDNQNQTLAQDIGYSASLDNLTIFNPLYAVDYDTFHIVSSKSLDMHCDAVTTDSLLDLEIYPFVKGREGLSYPDSVDGMHMEYYNNWTGVNPRLVIHSIDTSRDLYIRVYPVSSDRGYLGQIGAIPYTLSCTGGLGYPETTETPKPTKTATPSYGGGGGYNLPTATPKPLSNNFVASLLSAENPQQQQQPTIGFTVFTFSVYADSNSNKAADPNEAVSGVSIFVYDTTTSKIVQSLETDANGRISVTIQGQPTQYRYLIPILNINAQFPRNGVSIDFVAPSFAFTKIIP